MSSSPSGSFFFAGAPEPPSRSLALNRACCELLRPLHDGNFAVVEWPQELAARTIKQRVSERGGSGAPAKKNEPEGDDNMSTRSV